MLEGEISQIQLIERLVELWREQFTGAIRFENDGIIKIIYFKGGDILSASTNDRSDSIDEILMRAGKVSREHVKQALAKRKENETLGDALLNLGFITRKELTWARRVQVVGVIRSIAAWTDGSFTIVADYLPKRDEGTLFPLPQVLVELIVTEQDRARFERALEGGNAIFAKAGDFDDVFRRLGLNEDADAIVREIDGDKSANEIALASGRDTFNVYKLLNAMATLGIVTRVAKAQETPQFSLDDFAAAGVADAADMWSPETAAPEFQLDETRTMGTPTVEIPAVTAASEPEWASGPDARVPLDEEPMNFDPDPEPEPAPVPPPSGRMPAWDAAPREPMVAPIPVPIDPPADATEEQWGFDEAQIETARRATEPEPVVPPPVAPSVAMRRGEPKPRGGRHGLLVALLAIAILAAAGYGGFLWWQGQQEPQEDLLVRRPAPVRPRQTPTSAPVTTATVVEAPITSTTSTAPITDTATLTTTMPPAATSTAATATMATTTIAAPTPPPVAVPPPSISASPAPSQTAALPAVTPKSGRGRYDAMAREYAANPSGNFTIQIQILCQASNLNRVIRNGGDQIWFVPQTLGTRPCYRVFYGRYATRAEAQQAMATVPSAIRDPRAAIKPVPR